MKILIAATPLTGHVNPLLAIARLLANRGDDVTVVSAPAFGPKIEAAGHNFVPYEDGGGAESLEAELPPGPERWTHEFQRRFLDPMPIQAVLLRALIERERPDAILAGSMFLGVLPLLLDTKPRPPIVVVNVSFLFLDRLDGAPIGPGLPPARGEGERERYAQLRARADAAFVNPVRAYADARLSELAAGPLPASLTQSIVLLPDVFLQPTVPEFEYDYGPLPENLRFIGLLPSDRSESPLPDWWVELDPDKPVVLVTQGTLANGDLGELIEPTLEALASQDDLNVVATTGGRPVADIRINLPGNARASTFLPFDLVLPKVDLLVTNGGYGSISQALAAGVPIVSAGLTEDKAEVAARVGWSGVGINLATQTPCAEAICAAIRTIMAEQRFRRRAKVMADAFAARNAKREILTAIDALVHGSRGRT